MDSLPLTQASRRGRRGVFLLDSHAILRDGLRHLMDAESDLVVCGEANSGRNALAGIRDIVPDLLVMDISFPGINGLETIKRVKSLFPILPMLILSGLDERLYAERSLRAGAMGYVMKQEPFNEFLVATRQVLNKGVHLSHAFSSQLLRRFTTAPAQPRDSLEMLSDRELEVLQLLGRAFSTSEIAEAMGISVKTVETHRGNIRKKLGLRSGADLIRFALAQSAGLSD